MTNTSMAYMVNWEMKAVFYIDKTTEMIQIIISFHVVGMLIVTTAVYFS